MKIKNELSDIYSTALLGIMQLLIENTEWLAAYFIKTLHFTP
jgi:hypothetical protein